MTSSSSAGPRRIVRVAVFVLRRPRPRWSDDGGGGLIKTEEEEKHDAGCICWISSSRIAVVIATTMAFGDIIIRDDDEDWRRLVPRRLRPVGVPGIIVPRGLSMCLVGCIYGSLTSPQRSRSRSMCVVGWGWVMMENVFILCAT